MLVHSYIVTKYVEASILVFLISEGQLFGTLESNIFISDLKRYSRHPHESSQNCLDKKKKTTTKAILFASMQKHKQTTRKKKVNKQNLHCNQAYYIYK